MTNIAKFTEEVLNETSGRILVKFGAPWCGPCKMVEPVLEQMSSEGMPVFDVNTDEDPGLAQKYGIRGVPTFIVFENGEQVETKTGSMSKSQLVELLG